MTRINKEPMKPARFRKHRVAEDSPAARGEVGPPDTLHPTPFLEGKTAAPLAISGLLAAFVAACTPVDRLTGTNFEQRCQLHRGVYEILVARAASPSLLAQYQVILNECARRDIP